MITLSLFKICPPTYKARFEVSIKSKGDEHVNEIRDKYKTVYLDFLKTSISIINGRYFKMSSPMPLFDDGDKVTTYIQCLTSLTCTEGFTLSSLKFDTRQIHIYTNEDMNEQVFGHKTIEEKRMHDNKIKEIRRLSIEREISIGYLKLQKHKIIIPKKDYYFKFHLRRLLIMKRTCLAKTVTKESNYLSILIKQEKVRSRFNKIIKVIMIMNRVIKLLIINLKHSELKSTNQIQTTPLATSFVEYDLQGHPLSGKDIEIIEKYAIRNKGRGLGKIRKIGTSVTSGEDLDEIHKNRLRKARKNGEINDNDVIDIIKPEFSGSFFYLINGSVKLFTKRKNYKKPRLKLENGDLSVYDVDLNALKFCSQFTKQFKRAKRPINLRYKSNFTRSIISSCNLYYQSCSQVRDAIINITDCCWRTYGLIYFVRDVLYNI